MFDVAELPKTDEPRARSTRARATAAPGRTPASTFDHRAMLFRAVGVPDAVVDKVSAAAWLTLTGAGLQEHERFDVLLRCLHDGTAAILVDDLTARLAAGEFDALFVHRDGCSIEALAARISSATLEQLKIEAWQGRTIPINKQLCRDICCWVVERVVAYVDRHPFPAA